MIFKNNWNFGGEIVRVTKFNDGSGGNILIRGTSDIGGLVEVSVFMIKDVFQRIIERTDRENDIYKTINANGHFELRAHETPSNKLKYNLKLVADNFNWVS